MRRSCLVGLALVAAVLLAATASLRRCYLDRSLESAKASRGETTATGTAGAEVAALAEQTLEAALATVDAMPGASIEGLTLEGLQPVSATSMTVRGATTSGEMLYLLACKDTPQCDLLAINDPSGLTPVRQATITEEGSTAGGVFATGDALWVWLPDDSGQERTLLLVLDGETLQERSRLILEGRARTLVAASDGQILGISEDGGWFSRWDAQGRLLARQRNTIGIPYSDCELVNGSLVCAGVTEGQGGVLDVLDMTSLSLLARHPAHGRTRAGQSVVGGAWAYWRDRFIFVPQGGDLPVAWVYQLDGLSLTDYIPVLSH